MRKFIIAGADPHTGNLGVSALGSACISSLEEYYDDVEFTLIDSRTGIRESHIYKPSGDIKIKLCGVKYSKRIYEKESIYNINFANKTKIIKNIINEHLMKATAILDVSGGDSFTDLYGKKRFNLVNILKYYAIKNNIPLILLPQTYGPFKDNKIREEAKYIVKNATMAFARDEYSFESLKSLLGKSFDPNKHKCGVDMAFILPIKECKRKLNHDVLKTIENERTEKIGINISGLILNNPKDARENYKFKADYERAVKSIIIKLLEDSNKRIILIPHVLKEETHYESDLAACKKIIKDLNLENNENICVQSNELNENEVKWLISKTSVFIGTRMHATIAALSSKTPVVTISYSKKANGVFKSCGIEECVLDPTKFDTDYIIDKTICWINSASQIKMILDKEIETVREISKGQFSDIYQTIGKDV